MLRPQKNITLHTKALRLSTQVRSIFVNALLLLMVEIFEFGASNVVINLFGRCWLLLCAVDFVEARYDDYLASWKN